MDSSVLAAKRVLVVGDCMLDQYWFGDAERISPEAPVPVVRVLRTDARLGGAANVALNITTLGAKAALMSVAGEDEAGHTLRSLLEASGIESLLQTDSSINTTVKLRIIARQQQMLRADFEDAPTREVLAAILGSFNDQIERSDAVVLSDYGKGGLNHIRQMIEHARQVGVPVLIDPKGSDYSRYKGATLITPNRAELAMVTGCWSSEEELRNKAQRLREELDLKALLLTRSEEGMTLYTADGELTVPAQAREVFDVSGAGDTVIAVTAAMLAAGADLQEAVRIANRAGGIVVGKLGTASVSGFIGCNNVLELNRRGFKDVIAVDNLTKSEKFLNLAKCSISDYFDKNDFIERVRRDELPVPEVIFHQGACSDTMETDGRYMMENNYRYTLDLFHWAQKHRVPFIYASSAATYGASQVFVEDVAYEGPLNVYGYSKYLFDQVVRANMKSLTAPVAGMRYFNVYGPHEQHKGRMASVAFHQYFQFKKEGRVKLFEGCLGYGNGCQMRDFVFVEDVIDIAMYFMTAGKSGIFNCGSGRAQPFNDVALTVVNSLSGTDYTLEEAVSKGLIEYIPFPEALKGKYQAYTQADLTNLRAAGYEGELHTVQQGTAKYMQYLSETYPTGERV